MCLVHQWLEDVWVREADDLEDFLSVFGLIEISQNVSKA